MTIKASKTRKQKYVKQIIRKKPIIFLEDLCNIKNSLWQGVLGLIQDEETSSPSNVQSAGVSEF